MLNFREYWKTGGPILVVLGIAGVLLTGGGVWELTLSDTRDKLISGQMQDATPFILQIFAVLLTGVALILACLITYYKLKRLEFEKDLRVIESLERLNGDLSKNIANIYSFLPLAIERGISTDKIQEYADGMMARDPEISRRLDSVLNKGYANIES